jgi:hypothetical protein
LGGEEPVGYSKSSLTSVGEQPLVEDPYEKRTCQVRIWISITGENVFLKYFLGDFYSYYIQHGFICRPSDSTMPTDAGTVATDAMAIRRSNY